MLCDIALDESEGGVGYFGFECRPNDCLALCRIIDLTGEGEMARAIINYKTKGGLPANFRRYLGANSKYLQGRMLAYVKHYIERFY